MNSLSFAIFPVFYAWSDEIELSTELAITPRARTFTTITPLALPSQIQQRVYNFSVRSVVTRQSSLYTCIKTRWMCCIYMLVGLYVHTNRFDSVAWRMFYFSSCCFLCTAQTLTFISIRKTSTVQHFDSIPSPFHHLLVCSVFFFLTLLFVSFVIISAF